MGDSSLERRRAVRLEAALAVEVRDERGFSLHSTRDLSTGGLFFDRAIPQPVGALVELSFQLPGDPRAIRCQGEVANVPDAKGFGMGVRFVDLSPMDEDRIERFVAQVAARGG